MISAELSKGSAGFSLTFGCELTFENKIIL